MDLQIWRSVTDLASNFFFFGSLWTYALLGCESYITDAHARSNALFTNYRGFISKHFWNRSESKTLIPQESSLERQFNRLVDIFPKILSQIIPCYLLNGQNNIARAPSEFPVKTQRREGRTFRLWLNSHLRHRHGFTPTVQAPAFQFRDAQQSWVGKHVFQTQRKQEYPILTSLEFLVQPKVFQPPQSAP